MYLRIEIEDTTGNRPTGFTDNYLFHSFVCPAHIGDKETCELITGNNYTADADEAAAQLRRLYKLEEAIRRTAAGYFAGSLKVSPDNPSSEAT